jgi:hypothetical protein
MISKNQGFLGLKNARLSNLILKIWLAKCGTLPTFNDPLDIWQFKVNY